MDNKELEKEVLKTYVSNRYRSYKEAYLGGYSLSENRVTNLENRVKELEKALAELVNWAKPDSIGKWNYERAIEVADKLLTNK